MYLCYQEQLSCLQLILTHILNQIIPANSKKAKRMTSIFLFYFPHSSGSTFSADTAHLPCRHWEINNHAGSFSLGKKKLKSLFSINFYCYFRWCSKTGLLPDSHQQHQSQHSFFLAAMQQNNNFLVFTNRISLFPF